MFKKSFVFGITGQDGSYLAKLLLKKYEVHGVKRRSSLINTDRIDDIYEDINTAKKFFLHYDDVTDSLSVNKIICDILPDEIYNLAAQSHVGVSFETPEYTANVGALGTLRILESIKYLNTKKKIKFYQAGSSEMFGSTPPPQNERSFLIQLVLMLSQNFIVTLLLKTTEMLINYLHVMVFYLIMKVQKEVRLLLQKKL